MVEEKKHEGAGDNIKIFLQEALEKQRNGRMDNYAQILHRLPTGSIFASNSHSGGATLFKVQVNFEIPIFEGQIDPNIMDRWLNLSEGYFLVHNFSNWENNVFSLFKATPPSQLLVGNLL